MQMEIDKIPQQGNEETIFIRLRKFIDPVDIEWSKKIKPASEKLIMELYDMLGMKELCLKFPKSFLEFAKYAGESDGGLLLKTLHGEFSISKLISRVDREYLNPYIFVFLYDELEMEYSINLSKDNYQKISYKEFITDLSKDSEMCSNFEKLIFQCAVDLYEKKYYKYNIGFGCSINSFNESYLGLNHIDPFVFVDQLCNEYGLKKVWLSDEFYYFAYSKDISIVLHKRYSLCGSIFAEKKELIEIFKNELINKIGGSID